MRREFFLNIFERELLLNGDSQLEAVEWEVKMRGERAIFGQDTSSG